MNLSKFFITSLIIINCFYASFSNSIRNDIEENKEINNEKNVNFDQTDKTIIFKEKLVKCPMYTSPGCNFYVLIKKEIKQNSLNLSSSDTFVFKNPSLESCKNKNIDSDDSIETNEKNSKTINLQLCPNLNDFHEVEANKLNDYLVHKIFYEPNIVGVADLIININDDKNETILYKIIVSQPKRIIDLIFDVWVWVFSTLISMLMGVLIDRHALTEIIKMPIPIVIGFVCQYICMPLLAYSFCILFKLNPVESLALFIYGCSPGGSASNNWTILFDGDLNLSAILTFVSTCSSLFMLPAWVYTLGKFFSDQAQISIPFVKLLLNLIATIGPCLLGLLLAYCFPKLKVFVLKIAKPFTMVILLSFLIIVLVIKSYSFGLIKLHHWFAGPLIPWIGYLLGGGVALILRRPFNQVKTIAIETGIQNVGVAFLVVITNFPSPEADYAVLPLIAVAFLTNIPLYFVLLLRKLYNIVIKNFRKNKNNRNSKENHELESNETNLEEKKEMLPESAEK